MTTDTTRAYAAERHCSLAHDYLAKAVRELVQVQRFTGRYDNTVGLSRKLNSTVTQVAACVFPINEIHSALKRIYAELLNENR